MGQSWSPNGRRETGWGREGEGEGVGGEGPEEGEGGEEGEAKREGEGSLRIYKGNMNYTSLVQLWCNSLEG